MRSDSLQTVYMYFDQSLVCIMYLLSKYGISNKLFYFKIKISSKTKIWHCFICRWIRYIKESGNKCKRTPISPFRQNSNTFDVSQIRYLKDLFKAAQSKVLSFQPNKTNRSINLLIHYTTTYVHQKKIIKMRIIISYHRLYQLSQPYRS